MGAKDTRPNIILIQTEQQRFDTLRCAGYEWMDTPCIDKLGQEGVLFTHAFASAATCVSSRASFYSGLYPHTSGVYAFDPWTGQQNWTHLLKEAGYQCVSIGKTHMTGTDGGFHERIADLGNKYRRLHTEDGLSEYMDWHKFLLMKGYAPPLDVHRKLPDFWDRLGAIEWPLPDECHPDFFVGDMAIRWIEHRRSERPLFLFIGFMGPHDLYDPIARYVPPYMAKELPQPVTSEEEKRTQPPEFSQHQQRHEVRDVVTSIRLSHATPERLKRMRAHYYANITMIDEKIGGIMAALEEKGFLENAVIVFTSDHGDNLADHGVVYKGNMYDSVVRIPLILWGPSRFAGGTVIEQFVQQMDIAPVLLDLAGCTVPEHMEAISLSPLLTDDPERYERKYVFAEEGTSNLRFAPDVLTMIRSREWKLVHFVDREYGQLYDLQVDPWELNNLWDVPQYEDVKRKLLDDLFHWLIKGRYQNRNLYASPR